MTLAEFFSGEADGTAPAATLGDAAEVAELHREKHILLKKQIANYFG